ncbi:hypothetical protein E1283_18510 [Streptomyces hainanensis]|uniref:VOC domain-containing protein n=1 Tax=Streptomyces hainanensis TaxID=402648 RepID=A0A4R4TC75_9ACTN|nr:hypothetical protein E1283_18510 [Streptomyces hainanensis]
MIGEAGSAVCGRNISSPEIRKLIVGRGCVAGVPGARSGNRTYTLFSVQPAKRRPGYANFAISIPSLELVRIDGAPGEDTRLNHLGVKVETSEQVAAATSHLTDAGLVTVEKNDTTCWPM